MKTQEYYIGTRADFDVMNKVIPSPRRMNQGMSKLLRKAAIDNGIKATEQRKRLEFYSVSAEERETLKDANNDAFLALTENVTVRPLVEFNKEEFSDLINKINSKPEYSGGMNYETSCRYESEMRKSLAGILTKIGEDLNTRKKAEKKADCPYNVGDLLYHSKFNTEKTMFYPQYRVAKVGKRFVEIEVCQVKNEPIWSNSKSALTYFNDTITWGDLERMSNGGAHGHFIPMDSNEDKLEWVLWTEQNGKPAKIHYNGKRLTQFSVMTKNEIETRMSDATKDYEIHSSPGYYYDYQGW